MLCGGVQNNISAPQTSENKDVIAFDMMTLTLRIILHFNVLNGKKVQISI